MTVVDENRVTRDEALSLLKDAPLLELGQRAFAAKRARHGDAVTYVHNRQVNPTNLCVYSCRFCDFAAKPHDAHAYSLNEQEILESLADPRVREAHIVGGLWHTWGFRRSLNLVRKVREARPDLWIKSFTAVELAYFAHIERRSVAELLRELRDAGMNALPGGGVEVLSARVHAELFPDKIGAEEWLEIHETAHWLGIPSNATLLFGHIETDEEIVDHLLRLREQQDRSGGFVSFVPLAYRPGTTGLSDRLVSAPRCLRVTALARLVLDNFPHVKAYWPSIGVETAAAALNFGADDLDGTLGKERIMHLAGSDAPAALTSEDMDSLVHDAGQIPCERDGAYRRVADLSEREPSYAHSTH
jgi:aminodeoxyfutalosine synthase